MIKDVKKRPTTYLAVQFDGTNSVEVGTVLKGTEAGNYTYTGWPHISVPLKKARGYGYDTSDMSVDVDVDDWVVASSKGKVWVLSDTDYLKKFVEKGQQ